MPHSPLTHPRPSTSIRGIALLLLLLALAFVRPTLAAPLLLPPAFSPLTDKPLQDALNDSIAKSRLLIVVISNSPDRVKHNPAVWNNPALDAWVRLHAIAVHVTDREIIKRLIDGKLPPTDPESPLVFRDGIKVRLFGGAGNGNGSRLRLPPREAKKWPESEPNESIRLLMKLDWTLRSAAIDDPEWLKRHTALNPIPPAPKPVSFHGLPAEGVEAFVEPGGGPGGPSTEPDLFDLMTQAAALAADDKTRPKAIGIYTYLWELGDVVHPEFAPVQFFALAPRIHDLCAASEPTRKRFRAMRDADAALLPWLNHDEFFKWLFLCRIIDEHLEPLDFLDSALSDVDAGALMPPGDRAVFDAMLPRLNWNDPLTLPSTGNPLKFLATLEKESAAATLPGKHAKPTDAEASRAFATFLLSIETPRLHAALLAAGKDETAFTALKDHARAPEDRLRAIALALAVNQARNDHLALLPAGADKAWPGLRAKLQSALAPK